MKTLFLVMLFALSLQTHAEDWEDFHRLPAGVVLIDFDSFEYDPSKNMVRYTTKPVEGEAIYKRTDEETKNKTYRDYVGQVVTWWSVKCSEEQIGVRARAEFGANRQWTGVRKEDKDIDYSQKIPDSDFKNYYIRFACSLIKSEKTPKPNKTKEKKKEEDEEEEDYLF